MTDQQRPGQSGPVRHKPAPLNLQVPGSTMPDANLPAISTDMKSPYAGSYMQRQGYRPAQHPNGNLNGTGRPGADDADASTGLQYSGYSSGQGEDQPANSASYPRPSGLSHSSSLPLLPTASNFSSQPYTSGESGMVTPTFPPYPGMYNRAYSYQSPGMAVENSHSSYSSGMNGPPSSASTAGHLPLPPPFNHSYSSPSVPLYPPPLSHYSSYPPSGYGGHHYSPSGYLMSPTSANPPTGSSYPGTPGVLMINSSGQVIPHNPGSLVGGRGVPLSERPFKCDECIQSFVSFSIFLCAITTDFVQSSRTAITISSATRGSIWRSSHSHAKSAGSSESRILSKCDSRLIHCVCQVFAQGRTAPSLASQGMSLKR